MASLVNNHFKLKVSNGTIDLDGADIRAALLQTTTTADTEANVEFLSGYTTLGECNVASYARVALTGEAVALDQANNRAEFTANNIVWATLEAGNTLQGVLLYVHVTTDADSMPIAFLEFASNFTTNGSGLTLTPNAEGLLQLA